MDKKKYVLAVPNFSEGRDQDKIEKIVDAVRNVSGIKLISVEPESDFNRTVVTFIGEPEPVKKALVELGKASTSLLDMREQKGSHPRIGAQDSLPVFPLRNIELDEVIQLAYDVGKEYFEATGVPVYYCGECASNADRKAYAYVRKGQYEGVKQLLEETKDDPAQQDVYEARKPDLSKDGLLDEKSGATIVSAEQTGLTAYNVFLDTEDVSIAKKVAKAMRGPSGGFNSIRSVGVKFPEHKGVVVSMNMFDCINLPVSRLFNFCKAEAEHYGVNVIGSELVGPIKLESVLASFAYSLSLENFTESQVIETHLLDE